LKKADSHGWSPARNVIDKRPLRAPRANPVFYTDEKRIRIENRVIDKSNNGVGLFLSKIADCVRTASRPRAIGDPCGRIFVRAESVIAVRLPTSTFCSLVL
jgi:hypothetical protein